MRMVLYPMAGKKKNWGRKNAINYLYGQMVKWNSPIYQDAVKKQSESTQDLQEEIEIKNDSLDNR